MSNLYKSGSVVIKSKDAMVIDSNRLIQNMVEQRAVVQPAQTPERQPDEDGFISGIDATLVEQLCADEDNGISELVADHSVDMLQTQEEAEQILADARAQAELIFEEARQQGFEAGVSEAQQKVDSLLAERRTQLENEMAALREQLIAENEEMRAQMEPQLVETLLVVYSKVTKAIAEDKKDMIYFLVDNVLRNAEMSHEFAIRCSEEDFKFLQNNKDKLYGAGSPDIRIEIIKDLSMERNQCVIETDTGVFDCSLDIQLDNLRESIHLLSCLQE